MLKIGLTGGIGSGKTAVSQIFEKLGIIVIDTDVIARQLLQHDKSIIDETISKLGRSILDNSGTIDRKKLASIIFNNLEKKQLLESILHPAIRDEVKHQLRKQTSLSASDYVIIVIPLLFETGFDDIIDKILVVIASENSRINRVKQRDKRDVDEIRAIIKNQVDDDTRLRKADDIIENNNDFKQLESKVRALHNKYRQIP